MKKKVKYTMEKELFRLSKEDYNNLEEVVEFNKKLAERAKEKKAWEEQVIKEKAMKEVEHVRLSTLVRESNFSKEAIQALEEYDLDMTSYLPTKGTTERNKGRNEGRKKGHEIERRPRGITVGSTEKSVLCTEFQKT